MTADEKPGVSIRISLPMIGAVKQHLKAALNLLSTVGALRSTLSAYNVPGVRSRRR
jgi:hypothetical protein